MPGDTVRIHMVAGSWRLVTCSIIWTLNHDRAERRGSAFHVIRTVLKYCLKHKQEANEGCIHLHN
jgi:hypothetical protein